MHVSCILYTPTSYPQQDLRQESGGHCPCWESSGGISHGGVGSGLWKMKGRQRDLSMGAGVWEGEGEG